MTTIPIERVSTVEGFIDSSDLIDDPPALRARADEYGYLYFRNFLPRDLVLELRRQFLTIIDRFGWLRPGTDPMDAVADLTAMAKLDPALVAFCGVGVPIEAYRAVQKLELFHAIPHRPEMARLYGAIFGEAYFPHPRHIARLMLPAPGFTPTPAHQDFTHIQGTTQAWTCWMPVGDVPMELGGLSILAGSHRDGIYRYAAATGAGNLESIICETEHVWHRGAMRAGDVLTFHSHAVHKGNPCKQADHIRLSCDYRFQPKSREIEQRSLRTHCDVLEWEQVYEGWRNKDIQYYWEKAGLKMSEWDPALVQTHRKIC